ncbi:MAG: AmmeMemoRadiSam system protein B [Bacteroidales bacterium]|nr:AmmeMemoRadiSam system protein B [Bacteroidales bacterium]MCF8404975.1 AmmeMemoRadiSam system protein B [Bacteroidales bacterium]
MTGFNYVLSIIFFINAFYSNGQAQKYVPEQSAALDKIDRQAAVAGQFYAADPIQLKKDLAALFAPYRSVNKNKVAAIIAPHAGYVYSGNVATSAYSQVDFSRGYDNVFILASSHRAYYRGASIYSLGDYITPLGRVEVNQEITRDLIRKHKEFSYVPKAHINEHSIEVQLPFLQYLAGEGLKIVPIVIGTQTATECKKIAQALLPYFNERNLFVISSDFSHYPACNDAQLLDSLTAMAVVSNSPESLMQIINDTKNNNIDNLSTRACGWTSLLTLLYLTYDQPEYTYNKILYENSGDKAMGDKTRVVGYHSIAVFRAQNEKTGFKLNAEEKGQLLKIARNTIEAYLKTGDIPMLNAGDYSKNLQTPCGAFVTLKKNHQLRGCIGLFSSEEPLVKVIQHMAIAAATQDSRFPPVTSKELPGLILEISILTPLKQIKDVAEIELGKHGIYIKKGYRTGTFLPQVATETGWGLEEFLGHCARDKAGIGWYGWKEADLFTYEALVFGE